MFYSINSSLALLMGAPNRQPPELNRIKDGVRSRTLGRPTLKVPDMLSQARSEQALASDQEQVGDSSTGCVRRLITDQSHALPSSNERKPDRSMVRRSSKREDWPAARPSNRRKHAWPRCSLLLLAVDYDSTRATWGSDRSIGVKLVGCDRWNQCDHSRWISFFFV